MERKTVSLGESVAQQIKNSIFRDQVYKPGDQLPIEQELVEQLKVSRTALREGIKLLESEHILEIRRGVGTFVSSDFGMGIDTTGMNDEEIKRRLLNDWYEARLLWEVQAMPLVALRATNEELAQIEDLQLQIEEYINRGDKGFYELDNAFHKKLIRASHNAVLNRVVDSTGIWEWTYYVIAQARDLLQTHMKQNALQNHNMIIRYLKLRDGEGAALAMRYHLICAIEDLKK